VLLSKCIDKGRTWIDRTGTSIITDRKYMLQAGMEAEGLKRISLFYAPRKCGTKLV
jgi:hypothetical protein